MTGELIAETRKLYGDTQERLAKKLGVSVSAIRSWEQGRLLPPSDKVIKICKLYHVSSDYLLCLTRVDPFQMERQRERLTSEELAEVQAYSEYLLWKRNMGRK